MLRIVRISTSVFVSFVAPTEVTLGRPLPLSLSGGGFIFSLFFSPYTRQCNQGQSTTAIGNRTMAIDQALAKQQPERYAAGSISGLNSALAARQNGMLNLTKCHYSLAGICILITNSVIKLRKITINHIELTINDLINGIDAMVCKYMYKVVDRLSRFLAAENLYVNPTAGIVRACKDS